LASCEVADAVTVTTGCGDRGAGSGGCASASGALMATSTDWESTTACNFIIDS